MKVKSSKVVLATAFASALFLAPDDSQAAEWKVGMSSSKVKELQQLLKEKGFFSYPQATGYFGPITEEAVRAFQKAANLPVTGVVDDATYAKLRAFVPTARTLSVGMRGDDVKVLQQRLKQLGYFKYPEITGYFGTVTEAAVKQFQQANGLKVTGKADAVTIERLRQAVSKQTTTTSSSPVTLKIGSRGSEVSELQKNLKLLGYFTYPTATGYYGTITADAVRRFQKDNGLPATGSVDSTTLGRIADAVKKKTAPPAKENSSSVYLKIGTRGEKVKQVQTNLKQLGYFTYPEITGYYGTITADAVRRFQKDNGLPVTGSVDSTTFGRIEDAVKKKTAPPAEENRTSIYLTIGTRGEEVKQVQTNLKQLGYFTYPEITGYYGTITADAVRRFQKDAKLQANGIVDSQTYERLIGQAPASKGQASASKLDVMELIADAAELLGKPYVWGGETPQVGFDCSGFIYYLFAQQGISLPRTVADIWNVGKPVSSPAVGDIVFFETYKKGPSHAGIYIGNGQFVHSGASTGVTISRLDQTYWKQRYLGAKRY
ncbi:Peptidoglycan endopeptidase LytF [Geobacillus thermodenitrificans]|uniref:C40 family peptidase n=1 Tax=Geobacillus thermodenitrificans TaxID=33940 RepID=UPI000A2954E2|nr:peptidoglycan-binding protein [Geobacillus thermodenitrificans]ARP44167.1 Peptidoglycan endopeptidase LytF [Geobacillus thermodenitrificans]